MTIRDQAFAGMPISCPVIDAHTHIGPYHMSGWHQKYDRTDMTLVLEDIGRLGVDCMITAPHPLVQGRMAEANRIAAETARRFPGKVYGYISIVPPCGMDAVKKELETYSSDPNFVGLKFLTGYHGDLLQPEYEYAMDFADEVGCPVLCHEYGNIPDRREFVEALKNRHNMKLLIAHQGGAFAGETRACAPIIRDHENAYMEFCGSIDNALPAEVIAELVGEDKLIFGTDMISLDPKYDLGRIVFSPLADRAKEKILALNFLKLTQVSQMGTVRLAPKDVCF